MRSPFSTDRKTVIYRCLSWWKSAKYSIERLNITFILVYFFLLISMTIRSWIYKIGLKDVQIEDDEISLGVGERLNITCNAITLMGELF